MAFERIPKYLDSPVSILIFDPDDVIPLAVIYFVFSAMGKGGLGLLVGFVVTRVYQKVKEHHAAGFFNHLLYKWGIYKPPGIPDWIVREFYE